MEEQSPRRCQRGTLTFMSAEQHHSAASAQHADPAASAPAARRAARRAGPRPTLRPGSHVLRRSPAELQVGLDPATALVLPDAPAVRTSLRLLAEAAPVGRHAAPSGDPGTLEVLTAHGHTLDERELRAVLVAPGLDSPAAAALARSSGADAATSASRRRAVRTRITTFGPPAPATLADPLRDLVAAAGLTVLRTAAPDGTGPAPEHTSGQPSGHPPGVTVLVGVGEPHREQVDPLVRDGTPHLLVRMTEGRAVIGPFVVPGTTACLRCLDAHCTDADQAWPLLVRQYAEAVLRPRPDGAAEPVDPSLAALALAWAVRDLTAYADGRCPSTWSATVTLPPFPDRLETRAWLRHPGCGCSWQ